MFFALVFTVGSVSAEVRQTIYDQQQSCTTTSTATRLLLGVLLLLDLHYNPDQSCTTDEPQILAKKRSKLHCASACSGQLDCKEYNFDDMTNDCGLYKHKALFFETQPDCSRYKVSVKVGEALARNCCI